MAETRPNERQQTVGGPNSPEAEAARRLLAEGGVGTTAVPAVAALGSDPVANLGASVGLSQLVASNTTANGGAGTPWGGMAYGDPGAVPTAPTLPTDASAMPGISTSREARNLAALIAAQRQATDISDPFAASRDNARLMTEANMGHENWQTQQQVLRIRQNQILQDYANRLREYQRDMENFEREQARRNQFWDQAGRTAYGGGQAILRYYMGGGGGNNAGSATSPLTGGSGSGAA